MDNFLSIDQSRINFFYYLIHYYLNKLKSMNSSNIQSYSEELSKPPFSYGVKQLLLRGYFFLSYKLAIFTEQSIFLNNDTNKLNLMNSDDTQNATQRNFKYVNLYIEVYFYFRSNKRGKRAMFNIKNRVFLGHKVTEV